MNLSGSPHHQEVILGGKQPPEMSDPAHLTHKKFGTNRGIYTENRGKKGKKRKGGEALTD